MTIEALYADLDQARSAWQGLYEQLAQGQYDMAGPRPAIGGQSTRSFANRMNLVIEGLLGTRPADEESAQASVILAKAPEIRQAAQAINAQAQSLVNTLRSNWRDGVTLKDVNGNFTTQITQADGSVVTNIDMSGTFQPMDVGLNQLTTTLGLLLPICRANAVGDLSTRATALADVLRDIDAQRTQARTMAEAAVASAAAIEEREKIMQGLVTQAEAALAKLTALQTQATTDASSVTTLVEKIKTVGVAADTLEKLVAGHTSSVDAFQKQLDARNAEFAQFQSDTKTAKDLNDKREADIVRLIKEADAMISGSTTAGLAKSLEDTRVRYEKRMVGARTGFWFSVALLLASALPLAAHLLPGLVGQWIPALDIKAEGSPYAVLGKIVLLLPATWLTGFFTKAYADFFHLEREYAHKAALAMSVDGFKRQAPKYEEEITAEVFQEIRTNPAKGQAVEPVAHPLYDALNKAVSKVLDRKGEAGK